MATMTATMMAAMPTTTRAGHDKQDNMATMTATTATTRVTTVQGYNDHDNNSHNVCNNDDHDDGNNSCMEPLGTQPWAPSHNTLISSCTRRGLQLQVFSDAGAVDELHDGAVATQGGKV